MELQYDLDTTTDPAKAVYRKAAGLLGWVWSHAHGGYINDRYRDRPNTSPNRWDSYRVADDAEEACFWDHIETLEHAAIFVASQGKQSCS